MFSHICDEGLATIIDAVACLEEFALTDELGTKLPVKERG